MTDGDDPSFANAQFVACCLFLGIILLAFIAAMIIDA